MTEEPFFVREGARFIPQPPCRGPWDPKSLNGRVIVALCGFQIEDSYDLADYMPARLTVDMYRLPGFAPIEIKTSVVRDGTRIKVIDAEFISEGVSYARATSQWLKRGVNSEGNVWSPPDWDVPPPEAIEPRPPRPGAPQAGAQMMRPISGMMGTFGQKRMWIADIRELVGGTPLTPFMRAAGGYRARMYGLNSIGLRRHGFSSDRISALKHAYEVLFRSGHRVAEAVKLAKASYGQNQDVMQVVRFMEGTKRGICRSVGKEQEGEDE